MQIQPPTYFSNAERLLPLQFVAIAMASITLIDGIIDVGDIEVERRMGTTNLVVGDAELSMTNEEWQEFREKIL